VAGLTAVAAPRAQGRGRGMLVVLVLLAAALLAWVATARRMSGMDAGPGTDLGALGWFIGVWATMMAAMMLPSAAPAVRLFALAARRPSLTGAFVAGYLAVWSAVGLLAYGADRALAALHPGVLAWDRGGPWFAGGAVLIAALWQLTPLKQVCLRHCRSPLHFLLARWRPGHAGALRMGATHGAWCTGCCWALMLSLFAVGVMSLRWMVVVSAIVFAEKVLPGGERVSRGIAAALAVVGICIALAPGSVPGLTQPSSPMAMPAAMGR
jgi:predicted metal-binding membrane protein